MSPDHKTQSLRRVVTCGAYTTTRCSTLVSWIQQLCWKLVTLFEPCGRQSWSVNRPSRNSFRRIRLSFTPSLVQPCTQRGTPPRRTSAAQGTCSSERKEDANELIAVVSGLVHIRFTQKEWVEHSDAIEVDSVQGLKCRRGAESATPVLDPDGKPLHHNIQLIFPHLAHLYTAEAQRQFVPMNLTPVSQPLCPKSPSSDDLSLDDLSESAMETKSRKSKAQLQDPTLAGSVQFSPGTVGLLFGALEFAGRKTRYQYSVRCLSTVELWRIDRSVLEENLGAYCRTLLEFGESIQHVSNCWNSKRIAAVIEEGVHRPSGIGQEHLDYRSARGRLSRQQSVSVARSDSSQGGN